MAESRTNPFKNELFMDERHFTSSFEGPSNHDISRPDIIVNDEADILSDNSFGLSESEQLQMHIESVKELIQHCDYDQGEQKKKKLVQRLIELRIRLHELKEGPSDPIEANRVVCAHRFVQQARGASTNNYCERCLSIIWVLVQSWYRCRVCGFSVHVRCADLVTRVCAGARVKQNPEYILDISPEIGLSAQKYRCFECKAKLAFDDSKEVEPRLCDYTGLYFCLHCHWNDLAIIPARVVHNWDFVPQKVSRSSKQLLRLMEKKPLLKLENLNPALFNYIEDLRLIKKMRCDVLLMKCYLICCKEARNHKILLHLQKRQHFVENSQVFSLKDLNDLRLGNLVGELRGIMQVLSLHIRKDCESCIGNGFVCELCKDKTVIFPFDDYIQICHGCFAVFHRLCFERQRSICPRCTRRKARCEPELEL